MGRHRTENYSIHERLTGAVFAGRFGAPLPGGVLTAMSWGFGGLIALLSGPVRGVLWSVELLALTWAIPRWWSTSRVAIVTLRWAPPTAGAFVVGVAVTASLFPVPPWITLALIVAAAALATLPQAVLSSTNVRRSMACAAVAIGAAGATQGITLAGKVPVLAWTGVGFSLSLLGLGITLARRRPLRTPGVRGALFAMGIATIVAGVVIVWDVPDLASGAAVTLIGIAFLVVGLVTRRAQPPVRATAAMFGVAAVSGGMLLLAQHQVLLGTSLSVLGAASVGAAIAVHLHAEAWLGVAAIVGGGAVFCLPAPLLTGRTTGFALVEISAGAALAVGGIVLVWRQHHRASTAAPPAGDARSGRPAGSESRSEPPGERQRPAHPDQQQQRHDDVGQVERQELRGVLGAELRLTEELHPEHHDAGDPGDQRRVDHRG